MANPMQTKFQQRLEETQAQRHEVYARFANHDWLDVATPKQIVNRLRRAGLDAAADRVLRGIDLVRKGEGVNAEGDGLVAEGRPSQGGRPESLDDIGDIIYEQLIGVSEQMPVRFVHEASQAARSVGRVVTRDLQAVGTGFLVAPGLLLTNQHVIEDSLQAHQMRVQFDFAEHTTQPVIFGLRPDLAFVSSPMEELDYTLIAVEPVGTDGVPLERYGWIALVSQIGKAMQGQRVNVIHHPGGKPKKVSLRQNFLALVLDDHLHYVTDTEPGSSGSPVFNDEWEVVALHHASVNIVEEDEVRLYRDALGGRVPIGVDPDQTFVQANEGVRISRVVRDIRRRVMAERVDVQSRVEAVFAGSAGAAQGGVPLTAPRAGGGATAVTATGGTATWTIPVTLSVSVGGGGAPPVAACVPGSAGGASAGAAPSTGDLQREIELYNRRLNSQKNVFRALGFLQESRDERYLLTAAQLRQRKADYYDDLPQRVDNGALTPAELYDELQQRLSSTLSIAGAFPESLGAAAEELERAIQLESDTQYARSRAHLYTNVDLQRNRMLKCVYTGTIIAPEQLMLVDLVNQLDQDDLLPQRFRSNEYLNCEHIVPQSWFGSSGAAKSDLHHLIAADGSTNNFRSARRYGEIPDGQGEEGPIDEPAYVGVGGRRAGTNTAGVFEPEDGKEVVARATLYFLIAHQGLIDNYDADGIETLKNWARARNPSPFERHRNETIFDVQGNRNPLIDFREWIDLIDFTRGLG